jgi:hypothetical protein
VFDENEKTGDVSMKDQAEKKKLQYERPLVKRFPLRSEEAVLGFCKTATGGALSPPGPCNTTICKFQGS